jgi:hypothetical protein
MKPGGEEEEEEDVQVLVVRSSDQNSTRSHHQQQVVIRSRPYYRRWSPWLVSGATVACVAIFLVTMYVNDCPTHNSNCAAAGFLGRFAFQPLRENPLLGPSSATYVTCFILFPPGRQWLAVDKSLLIHSSTYNA